jgi:hypothetical protein
MKSKTDISGIQYMRAHGNAAGPTHRPLLTGLLSGIAAAAPAIALRLWSGALGSEGAALGLGVWLASAGNLVIFALSGLLYAYVFQRAANELCSGWLLGISFGFLLWVIGPVTVWDWTTGEPLATGTAAIGLFASYIVFGLALGAIYPMVNRLTQAKLD